MKLLPHQENAFKSINNRSAGAIIAAAAIFLFCQILTQVSILNMRSDVRLVNISSRQRALMQEISALALAAGIEENDEMRRGLVSELSDARKLMQMSHDGLRFGNEDMFLPGRNSDHIDALFQEAEESSLAFWDAAAAIEENAVRPDFEPGSAPRLYAALRQAESILAPCVDRIVYAYGFEANRKLRNLQVLEFSALSAALATLALLWGAVLYPAHKTIHSNFEKAREHGEYLNTLFETTPALSILFDASTLQAVKFNSAAERMVKKWLDIELDNDMTFNRLLAGTPESDLDKRILSKLMLEGTIENLEVPIAAGKTVIMSAQTLEMRGNKYYLVGFSDVTTIKLATAFDSLTSMLNRRAGMDLMKVMFEQCKGRGKELVICFIDIDRLKFVNDIYGHPEGDTYIRSVAEIITSVMGEECRSMRYGGDEIILIADNMDVGYFRSKMEAVNSHLEAYRNDNFKPYAMSVSYGFAGSFEEGMATIFDMIQLADRGMYEQKKAKRVERRRFPQDTRGRRRGNADIAQ